MKFFSSFNLPIQNWKNKKIWVIGASSGIGLSLSKALLQQEAKVALTSRNAKSLENIASQHFENSIGLPANVENLDELSKSFKMIQKSWSDIDLVIYSAALYQPMRSWEIGHPMAIQINNVNLTGLLNVLSLVVPHFYSTKQGHIAIVSSLAGYFGMPNSLIYGATKAALINLAETLYVELRPKGIGVHLINPGFVKTRLTEKNDFNMPFLISTEEATKQIILGLEKGQFEIHFPKRLSWLIKLIKLLPYRIYFSIMSVISRNVSNADKNH